MWDAFSWQYLPLSSLLLIKSITQLYQTQVLADLIGYLGSQPGQVPDVTNSGIAQSGSLGEGIALAIVLACCSLLAAALHHGLFFMLWRWGMRWRSAVTMAVFHKAVRTTLPSVSRGGGPGSLVNVLSSDTEVLNKISQFLVFVMVGWIEVVGSCVLLYNEMGVSSLAGIAVLVLLLPVQSYFGSVFKRLRSSTASATDRRVRAVRQVVAGIKSIKVAAWEVPMHARMQAARAEELKLVQQASSVRAANEGIFTVVPVLMGSAIFLTRWGMGLPLTARGVFTAISLGQLLQLMVKFCMLATEALAEGTASFARLERFFALPEVKMIGDAPPGGKTPAARKLAQGGERPAVWADRLSTTWRETAPAGDVAGNPAKDAEAATESTPALALRDVSLEARRGELHVVVGPVAAGKSTLLLSLLGECPQAAAAGGGGGKAASGPSSVGGGCGIEGRVAYCPQEAWVVSGSLRQNVMLSRGTRGEADGWEGERDGTDKGGPATDAPWLEDRFAAAVESTGLEQDAAAFEDGYETMLGAQGKRASGGQKARVNLARAVFDPRADAVLLDDPLSAVDARTARRIVERCIQGLLLRRGPHAAEYAAAHAACGPDPAPAVVLATHQLQWLPVADRVTVLVGGGVRFSGTPDEVAAAMEAEGVKPADEEEAAALLAREAEGAAVDETAFLSAVLAAARGSIHAASAATGADDLPVEALEGDAAASASEGGAAAKPAGSSADADAKDVAVSLPAASKPPAARKAGLEEKESSTKGVVKWSTYGAYVSAAAGPCAAAFIGIVFVSGSLLLLAASIWLSVWTGLSPAEQQEEASAVFAHVYSGIVAAAVVLSVVRMILFFRAAVSAGQHLHDRALASVLGAPMRWFEQNPVGRVVSRFSKDLYLIDTLLPLTFEDFLNVLSLIVSAFVLICVSNPWVLFAAVPLGFVLLSLRQYYLLTSREVQRLEAVSRSPVFRMLVESLDGLDSARAYGLGGLLGTRMARVIDNNMASFFMFLTTSRWLGTRLDVLCSLFLLLAAMATVGVRDFQVVDPGLAGLSLSLVIQFTGVLQWCFRQSAMLEVQMVSVERLLELEDIKPEGVETGADEHAAVVAAASCCGPSAALVADGGKAARKASEPASGPWPGHGGVEFRDVWLRYRPGLPYVLRGVSFGVPAGSLVGVIGRTGAGKTTLTAAALRLVEIEAAPPTPEALLLEEGEDAASDGEADPGLPADAPAGGPRSGIVIGGDDVRGVHLTALRRGLAVIDQDPTLFAGTLRSNVDPFDDYDDAAVTAALAAVQMRDAADRRGGLNAAVEEGGANLSVGERQLVCLARAVLRNVRVQVYDEPTAFSDVATDEKLQRALRAAAAASKSTVFTVAHRLRTVADHNLLVVMHRGRVEEFGSPAWLLASPDAEAQPSRGPEGAWGFRRTGAFRSLVGQLGGAEAEAVEALAARNA